MNGISWTTLALAFVYVMLVGFIADGYRRTRSFNPIDWIWGPRLYEPTTLDTDELLIEVNQFPHDEYMVRWAVVMYETYRDRGPKWVRKRKLVDFIACWSAGLPGIPTSAWYIKDSWSGEFSIKNPFDWRYDACTQLENWIKETRLANGDIVDEIRRYDGYDGFGAPISNPKPDEITTSTSDNDLLKSKYTIEELAQQALNRDKDPYE